jgi:hypothetical protein
MTRNSFGSAGGGNTRSLSVRAPISVGLNSLQETFMGRIDVVCGKRRS